MAVRRPLRLSTRVTLVFGAMALIGGIGFAVATFLFARSSLLDQREVDALPLLPDELLEGIE